MNSHISDNAPLRIDEAWDMLSFIPAEDRDDWISIGMSLKAEFDDAGFNIYDAWSQGAQNYSEKSVRDVWKSFKRSGRSVATLIHLAKQNGWTPGRKAIIKPLPTSKKPPTTAPIKSLLAIELFLASNKSNSAVSSHPYAISKGIDWSAGVGRAKATGRIIGKNSDSLIIPIRNIQTNKVQGCQCVNAQGKKQTLGQLSEGALIIGNTLDLKDTWFVAEGWASAVSVVHHHNKQVCACSFGKGNLENVARKIDAFYKPNEIIILREVDT